MNDHPDTPIPMRRKDRQTSEAEARELLTKGEYGVLSTVGPDGLPYGVPLSYAFRDEQIVFHSAPDGRKVDHLTNATAASFCVVGATEIIPEKSSTRYQSVIASGEVYELHGEAKTVALESLVEKYSPEFMQKGAEYIAAAEDKTKVFSMHVRHLTGKQRL